MTRRLRKDGHEDELAELRRKLAECEKYPEAIRAETDARAEDLRTISRLAQKYDRGWRDVGRRQELLRLVRDARRVAERPPAPGFDFDFDEVPGKRSYPALVALGELLIRTEHLTPRVGRLVRDAGLASEPMPGLDNKVHRLRTDRATVEHLAEVAKSMQRQGVPVSFDYISPLAVVIKGEGGVEKSVWQPPYPGDVERGSVRVAVVDTGRSPENRNDRWLTGVAGDEDPLYIDGNRGLGPGAGHGTFVTGIVRQIAPHADIKVYAALDQWGIGREADVAAAMVRAAREGLEHGNKVVLNLSFGVQPVDGRAPIGQEVALELIDEAVADRGAEAEVLIVAAAGNYGTTKRVYPAAFRRVVSVAAVDQGLQPVDWSSRGDRVDCSTVGVGVRSTYVPGDEWPPLDTEPDHFDPDAWGLWAGTSFAAPQIAAEVARLAHENGFSLHRALTGLLAGGTSVPGFGRVVTIPGAP